MTPPDSEYTSPYFQTRFSYDKNRDVVWQEVCAYLQPRYIPIDAAILELGAGWCHFINNIKGRERHALDLSPDLASRVAAGVVPHVASCASLAEFGAGAFNVVFASNLFEHLTREELKDALREILRVLAPGGRLVIVQPNFRYCVREYFDDYTHLQVFTHLSLADRLSSAGFEVTDVMPRFIPFSMKSSLPKSRLLVRLYLHSPVKPFGAQMLVVARKG